jgi:hypothetical protein
MTMRALLVIHVSYIKYFEYPAKFKFMSRRHPENITILSFKWTVDEFEICWNDSFGMDLTRH